MKIIISGGGTGGHLYPALAIANALKEKGIKDILFVGAKGKIEMEKVPKAGYPIEGLWISGFHRQRMWRNISFPFKLISSLWKARSIIEKFEPDVVVGVGGYASGPLLKMAQRKSIPTLIQEQNSYPGITNKLLAKGARKICVAYQNMNKYFDENKIVFTGNPVRKDLADLEHLRGEAINYFGLDRNKKTLLIFGGSLGARSINKAVFHNYDLIKDQNEIQVLWQCGKIYYDEYKDSKMSNLSHVKILPFIDRMDLAYAVANAIVCRAGALTISEVCLTAKPVVLVPSPNVAEDHQTQNAMALINNNAAWLVKDKDANEQMIKKAFELIKDEKTQKSLSEAIFKMARPNAREDIANEILNLLK
ncbi:MAG: undecaprenyldiphospho-muramoylpentapeptide beta-N-acetylglucosaminyltransferase [Saprospiraceae bacterium]|nr:undecaprenyldiphospho-muramoylpentapeptide beta-N-acetylglucosaminyltransferase [Bacteroidia bacterium]NNE13501.1 undecaprenyldiphospho-muramoylpentapeptide beta-N-acetylglucosaminyltransferase [Saprospiraceae bacterium]NNL91643.1 undecaprenyldiphospho-muramoylpentapeptide beta-N-acetylglucosaminyltransferase [Saprospiraceae bacterium]